MASGKLIKNLKHIRLVTFDITGTLLKFRKTPSEQYVEVAESFGYTIPPSLLSTSFVNEYKIMTTRHPNYGKTTHGMTYLDWWRVLEFKTDSSWILVDGTAELITKIRAAGITVGVISNFDGSLEEVLKNMKLPEVDFVLTSYECGASKPHPHIFQTALTLAGNVKPQHSLHIGDTFDLDYLGAKNAGWSAILVNPSDDLDRIKDHRMYNDTHVFPTLRLFLDTIFCVIFGSFIMIRGFVLAGGDFMGPQIKSPTLEIIETITEHLFRNEIFFKKVLQLMNRLELNVPSNFKLEKCFKNRCTQTENNELEEKLFLKRKATDELYKVKAKKIIESIGKIKIPDKTNKPRTNIESQTIQEKKIVLNIGEFKIPGTVAGNKEEFQRPRTPPPLELKSNQIPFSQLKDCQFLKTMKKDVIEEDLMGIYGRFAKDPSSIEIKLMQHGRMKGQAFVTFTNFTEKEFYRVEEALNSTLGFILKKKPMIIASLITRRQQELVQAHVSSEEFIPTLTFVASSEGLEMEPLEHNSSSSNNSIEEDIQEAVEESDESLPLPLDDTNSSPPSVEQDSTSHYTVPIPIEEKSTSDERFKINPDQLFGDNLLKHFKPPDPEDDESTTQDISDLKDESHESHESHEETLKGEDIEKDNSIQEITVSNHSIEMTYESIDINNESQINRILASPISEHSLKDDEELAALKERIRMLKDIQKPILPKNMILSDESDIVVKQMERVPTEFSKEVLEDITKNPALEISKVEIVAAKDLCMQALNMQLEMGQRRESNVTNESFQPSGRESLITTTSTEYRTFAEDFYGKNNDFYMEIVERDNLITQLKESLQRSLQAREDLDTRTVNLTSEVQQLRKQIQELIESKRSQIWRRGGGDQESVGQRLSEISMELVSETDDDIENPLLTDNEDRISRSSRERQLSNPPEMEFVPINKELEEFQDSLAHYEIPIYYAIRKKFDEFISQELEKLRENYESERKIAIDQIQAEKDELRLEVDRLQIVLTNTKSGSNDVEIMKKELEAIHAKEMAELSQEVFSLKSQRNGSSCESSDQEELPSETKELSPRKKSKESLYSSPSHRQITPNNDSDEETLKERELKQFYKEKIEDMNKAYDDILKQLKRYEKKYGKFEFLSETEKEAENNISTFTIVDQDELSENDIAEIQKIKDDYERRLEEQVAQAKKDFFNELAKQVQVSLAECL
uniref:RRM domain-containing protein n=1 Tax=Megaselia scalaris TaxID=36166 RepID=T1GQ31_MEGSC